MMITIPVHLSAGRRELNRFQIDEWIFTIASQDREFSSAEISDLRRAVCGAGCVRAKG